MTATNPPTTHQHLQEIPHLYNLLTTAAHTRNNQEGPRPAPASKPPLRLDILHLQDTRTKWHNTDMAGCDPNRQGALPYLNGWVRDIEADHLDQSIDPTPPTPNPPTIQACCQWLTNMLPYAQTLPQWPELANGIRRTHTALQTATAGVRDTQQKPVPCNHCGNGQLKPVGPKLWGCGSCGHEVSVQAVTLPQARRILKEVHGDKAPTLRTLQNWAKRPGLLPGLLDGGPRSGVYDMATIHGLTAKMLLRG